MAERQTPLGRLTSLHPAAFVERPLIGPDPGDPPIAQGKCKDGNLQPGREDAGAGARLL
jgi:hypothetical protein